MNNSFFKAIISICIVIFYSCGNNSTTFPKLLNYAISVFYTENQNKLVITNIEKVLATPIDNPTKQISLVFKAGALCELNFVDSAFNLINSISIDQDNNEMQFWFKSIKGLILFRQNKISEAHKILLETTNSKFVDTRALALTERLLARISFTHNDDANGFQWMQLSSKHFNETKLLKSIGVNYKILGRHFIIHKNYNDALVYFKRAEEIFKKYNDTEELIYVYINLIDYYQKTSRLLVAKHYAILCMKVCTDDFRMKALVYNNMGEIEMKLNNLNLAIEYFNKTLELATKFHYSDNQHINAHINLSDIYNSQNNHHEALLHLNKAYDLAPKAGFNEIQYELFHKLSDTYKIMHQNEKALLFLDSARLIIDSISTSNNKSTKSLFDTKIELIDTSDKLKQIEVKHNYKQVLLITIISLLTLLSIFITIKLNQQRAKNKSLRTIVKEKGTTIDQQSKLRLTQKISKKTERKSQNQEKLDLIYNNLIIWLETDKRFTYNNLSLELLAKEINTNREYLSNAINVKNTHLIDLINKYRVNEAINILSDTTNNNHNHKLTIIAHKVGFNSDSAFIDAFFKQTGKKPSEFRRQLNINE